MSIALQAAAQVRNRHAQGSNPLRLALRQGWKGPAAHRHEDPSIGGFIARMDVTAQWRPRKQARKGFTEAPGWVNVPVFLRGSHGPVWREVVGLVDGGSGARARARG